MPLSYPMSNFEHYHKHLVLINKKDMLNGKGNVCICYLLTISHAIVLYQDSYLIYSWLLA